MKDARTPEQLGEALAEKMLEHHPTIASPQMFIMSSNFEGFCNGRGFGSDDRLTCERAYQRRYKELTDDV
jgi:hypothetical protein